MNERVGAPSRLGAALTVSLLVHALLFGLRVGDSAWRGPRPASPDGAAALRVELVGAAPALLAAPPQPEWVPMPMPAKAVQQPPVAQVVPVEVARDAAVEAAPVPPAPPAPSTAVLSAGEARPLAVAPGETALRPLERSRLLAVDQASAPAILPLPLPVAPAAAPPALESSAPVASAPAVDERMAERAAQMAADKAAEKAAERAAERATALAARQEAERQQVARLAAEQLEAARAEQARRDIERQNAEQLARQEALRAEAARQAAARDEAVRAKAAEAAADEARREASRRAMGRQLDEEAAQREAAEKAGRQPGVLPAPWSPLRRARLYGHVDPNPELLRYAEAWARKIQLNTAVDTVRELAAQPHQPALVTVALRSDGSVEAVTVVVSSGRPEVDEAIRRIVLGHRPYAPFQPALARDYDVLEIRRSWTFNTAVWLH